MKTATTPSNSPTLRTIPEIFRVQCTSNILFQARFNLTRPARPGFRLRRPIMMTRRPTTTATSRPTRTRMAKPQVTMRPFRKFLSRSTTLKPVESQATPKPTKPTTTRHRLFPRRPAIPPTPPYLEDSHHESTRAEEATSLRDLAIALGSIQQAPVPSESNRHAVLEHPGGPHRGQQLQERAPQGGGGGPVRSRHEKTTAQPPTSTSHPPPNGPRPLPLYRLAAPSAPAAAPVLPPLSKVLLHADGSVECLDQGSFPHPASCRKFVSCSMADHGRILGWEYTCPTDLSFDPIGGMCNWSADLGCDDK